MKKSLIFVLFSLFSLAGFSQVSWNAKAGMNMSNWSGDNDTKMKVGYKLGVGMEYAFDKAWSLQPSLFLSSKGAKVDAAIAPSEDIPSGLGLNMTVNQLYLELPINAQVRFAVSEGMNIVLAAGPYLAYGVGGNTTVKAKVNGVEVKESRGTFSSSDVDIDRFDAGFGIGASLEIKKFIVGVDGQWGAIKLNSENETPKNINFSICVGYKF